MYFFRHAETEWNRQGRFHGSCDSLLTNNGRKQFQTLCHKFVETTSLPNELKIFVSPQQRAIESAQLLSEITTSKIIIETRLREVTLGSWDGLTIEEIQTRYPNFISTPINDDWFFNSPDGERLDDAKERVLSWYNETKDEIVCAVSHGIIGRILIGLYCGYSNDSLLKSRMPQNRFYVFSNGSVKAIGID